MAYVTVAQLQAGTAAAGAGFVLQAPAAWVQPATFAAAYQRRLAALAQSTATRLKRAAQAAYSAYPRIAAGFQQVTSLRGGTVVVGLVAVSPMIAFADGGTVPLFNLREYDTPAHTIRARRFPYLLWKDREGGWHKAVEVHHPGTHGLYAVAPLFAAEADRFLAALTTAALETLDGL